MLVPATVVSRYLGKQSNFGVLSDDRYRPPKSIVNAVSEGVLPVETLNVWKYVVVKQGDHFDFAAAVAYWRNKCAKMDIVLPEEFLTGLGGKGGQGAFAVKTAEQIEDWVKEALKSKGLLADVGNSVHDWQMEIDALKSDIREAQETIELHLRVIADGKLPSGRILREKGIAQRQKWLENAQSLLSSKTQAVEEAQKSLEDLKTSLNRYDTHKSPTVEFEREFQFLMQMAAKDFDKKAVITAVQNALQRFEQGLDMPESEVKVAGLMEVFTKVWNFLKSAWESFTGWLSDLTNTTQKIDALLDKAGA